MTYPSRSGSGFASQPRVTFFARQTDGNIGEKKNAGKTRQNKNKASADLLSISSLINVKDVENKVSPIG